RPPEANSFTARVPPWWRPSRGSGATRSISWEPAVGQRSRWCSCSQARWHSWRCSVAECLDGRNGNAVENVGNNFAFIGVLDGSLGGEDEPMGESWFGDALYVVGGDELAVGDDGVRATGFEQPLGAPW